MCFRPDPQRLVRKVGAAGFPAASAALCHRSAAFFTFVMDKIDRRSPRGIDAAYLIRDFSLGGGGGRSESERGGETGPSHSSGAGADAALQTFSITILEEEPSRVAGLLLHQALGWCPHARRRAQRRAGSLVEEGVHHGAASSSSFPPPQPIPPSSPPSLRGGSSSSPRIRPPPVLLHQRGPAA